MRKNSKLIIPMAAVAVAIALTIAGQEEPLPLVHAKSSLDGPVREPANYLVAEPNRPFDSSLLADAARANDFGAFDALFNGARRLGRPVAAYSTLHELWAWSMTDPVGAFYGQDTHERFASAFPGYGRYIEEFRIVDNHGNAFYPTSETRVFLLSRALEGQSAQSPVISRRASAQRTATTPGTATTPATTSAATRTTQPERSASQRPRSTSRAHHTTTKSRNHVSSTTAATETRAAAPAVKTPAVRTPAVDTAAKSPVVRKAAAPQSATSNPAPVTSAATTPASSPTTTPASITPTSSTTASTTTNAPSTDALNTTTAVPPPVTEAPIVVKAEEPVPAPATVETQTSVQPAPQPVAAENPFMQRGMLLLVIGLLGFGILALILRTPKEVPTSILPPTPAGKPPAPVEPFRKTPSQGSAKAEDSKKPRATGSHG